jgi:hypothetical protein
VHAHHDLAERQPLAGLERRVLHALAAQPNAVARPAVLDVDLGAGTPELGVAPRQRALGDHQLALTRAAERERPARLEQHYAHALGPAQHQRDLIRSWLGPACFADFERGRVACG